MAIGFFIRMKQENFRVGLKKFHRNPFFPLSSSPFFQSSLRTSCPFLQILSPASLLFCVRQYFSSPLWCPMTQWPKEQLIICQLLIYDLIIIFPEKIFRKQQNTFGRKMNGILKLLEILNLREKQVSHSVRQKPFKK